MIRGPGFIMLPSYPDRLADALLSRVSGLRDSPELVDSVVADLHLPTITMAAAVHYAKRVLRDTPIGEVPGPVEAFLRLVEEVVDDGHADCVGIIEVELFEVLDIGDQDDQRLESLLLPRTHRLLEDWRARWAATDPTLGIETVFVQLLDEGMVVWRPVSALRLTTDTYRLLPSDDHGPDLETREFPPGSVVRCEVRDDGTERATFAIRLVPP